MMGGMMGGMPGGRGGFGGNMWGNPLLQGIGGDNSPKRELTLVELEKSANAGPLAVKTWPLRMAIIVASFPYKAQLEEFQVKLHKGSLSEVLAEDSLEPDEQKQVPKAFRFAGVNVERREINAEGKPVAPNQGKDGWVKMELEKQFRPFMFLTGRQYEPEDQRLALVRFTGLTMPKLAQMRDGLYPPQELELKNLGKTLEALSTKAPSEILKPPDAFQTDTVDIFSDGNATGATPSYVGGMGTGMGDTRSGSGAFSPVPGKGPGGGGPSSGPSSGGAPGFKPGPGGAAGGPSSGPGERPEGKPGRGGFVPPGGPDVPTPPGAQQPDVTVPEYCLVRLIDVTIEPGKIYQYRLQVRMGNPNQGHKDVASPGYTKDKELTAGKWFEVPQKVVVPPEMQYYAVDQAKAEKDYKGQNARETPESGRQTVLQIHRWLDHVLYRDKQVLSVGEWSVAERLLVYRGEYVGRMQKVEVPYWVPEQENYVLAVTPGSKPKIGGLDGSLATGVEVNFAHEPIDTLLVDFEGGDMSYQRMADGKPSGKPIREATPTEVLLLSPEGKLLAHDSLLDTNDEARKKRLEEWRSRIKDVREHKGKEGTTPGNTRNPFDRN
jgi:hypothetical protein